VVEALQLSHELDQLKTVWKPLQKDIKAEAELNRKLIGDPRRIKLKRRQEKVGQDEKAIEQLVLANANELRRL
jgi:hypothetical protein